MPLHSYFALTAFSFLLMFFTFQYLRLKHSGSDVIGIPTIEKLHFYSGKIAIITSWTLFVLKAISPGLGYVNIPTGLSWVAVGLLYFGVIILTMALLKLGKSLRVGLPGKGTKLCTTGIYRISRNPIYLGVHIIAVASCIYFPDLINVTFTIYGIFMHHRIIKQEERFLAERFGTDWLIYSAKVSRYV
ncbi:MAG: isoprenylcysteine carboxylmethyltransferase family protein [Bacteroidales bacterium]|nr:isoprenylcysteine carboxylmethyltransferase family protein [Bacteroidales bacterium]